MYPDLICYGSLITLQKRLYPWRSTRGTTVPQRWKVCTFNCVWLTLQSKTHVLIHLWYYFIFQAFVITVYEKLLVNQQVNLSALLIEFASITIN